MGIVNVTPDSFSDGGHFFDADAGVEHGLRLAAEGADILDIGGESTRPGMPSRSTRNEELRRVMPVIEALARQIGVPLSIDTSKAAVARQAVARRAPRSSTTSPALAGDPEMLELAVETGCGVCVDAHAGHAADHAGRAGLRATWSAEVLDYLAARRDALLAAGIEQAAHRLGPGHRLRQDASSTT